MRDDVRDEVVLLRAQVDYLLDRVGDHDGLGARPVNWTTLTAEAAAEQWAVLAGWVDWLLDRYRLVETVPGCWYAHAPILEELSALHAAWLGAYCDPAASAPDGVLWHDMLDRVVMRIREHDIAGCAVGTEHRADVAAVTRSGSVAERADAIRIDITARPTTAATSQSAGH